MYSKYFKSNYENDFTYRKLNEVTIQRTKRVNNELEYKVLSAVKIGELKLSEEYFNKSVPSKKLDKYIIVKQNDYSYNPARINIGSIGRNKFDFKTCVSPVYIAFSVEDEYKYFFDFYFKDDNFKNEVITRASGSVRQTLNYEEFGLIPIYYPSKKIVKEFNYFYEPIYQRIIQKEIENETLTKLRDTLLPKLMNGEIDLDKIEI